MLRQLTDNKTTVRGFINLKPETYVVWLKLNVLDHKIPVISKFRAIRDLFRLNGFDFMNFYIGSFFVFL